MIQLRDLFAVVFVSACLTAALFYLDANLPTVTMFSVCFVLSVFELFNRKIVVYSFWIFSFALTGVNLLFVFFVDLRLAADFGLLGPITIIAFGISAHCISKTRPSITFVAMSLLAMAICFWVNATMMGEF